MKKKLTLLGFFSLTIATVMDVYEYPIFATSQFHLIFYLIIGGFFWFIPTALCSAEMATIDGWEEGGVFTWVKNTIGERFGFVAIFAQWFQITIGFVTMLYFIVSALSYAIDIPIINQNPIIKLVTIVAIFWIITVLQFRGTSATQLIAKIGSVCGIILPAVLLVILSAIYLLNGNPSQLDTNNISWIPDFSQPATLVIFVSFMLSYMGVEASSSFVNELDNPKRNYPIAMFMVVVATILINAIGGLAIANVIPQDQLSLSGGIIQGFEILFGSSLQILTKIVALMIAFGVIAEISSWVVGPARGMYVVAQKGLLPPIFRKVNKNNVPVVFITFQGIIVTLWAAVLTLGSGGNNLSFTIAISLATVVYVITYLLLYAGYLVFTIKMADLPRGYTFGNKPFKIIIAILGLTTTIFALVISFIPPSTLSSGDAVIYQVILYSSFAFAAALPFVIYHFHDKKKHKTLLRKPSRIKAEEVNRFIDPRARGEHEIQPTEEDYL